MLDGAQITVPERVSYKTKELSLSLMPGNQTIKGETLLKYFRYFLTPSGGGAIKQSELLCVMFRSISTRPISPPGATTSRR